MRASSFLPPRPPKSARELVGVPVCGRLHRKLLSTMTRTLHCRPEQSERRRLPRPLRWLTTRRAAARTPEWLSQRLNRRLSHRPLPPCAPALDRCRFTAASTACEPTQRRSLPPARSSSSAPVGLLNSATTEHHKRLFFASTSPAFGLFAERGKTFLSAHQHEYTSPPARSPSSPSLRPRVAFHRTFASPRRLCACRHERIRQR